MNKITRKKFNELVDQEVKEQFKMGKWHKSEIPEIEKDIIEEFESLYEVVE